MVEQDQVIPLPLGFRPEAGAPAPILLQDEQKCFLVFDAHRAGSDDVLTGIIEVVGCSLSRFGYPNDEALSGHPLYHRGLDYYGVFEVLSPSWREQLASMNIAAGFEPGGWGDTRHFVVTFHDSTFECLARDLHGETTERPRRDVVQRLAGQRLQGTRDDDLNVPGITT